MQMLTHNAHFALPAPVLFAIVMMLEHIALLSILGIFRDKLGTYSVGFYISAILLLLCIVILISLLAYLKPRKWKNAG